MGRAEASAAGASADAADDLSAIIAEILALPTLDALALDRILRRRPKQGRGFYSKREILSAYRSRRREAGWPVGEDAFAERLRTCPTRSLSGVLPVTVLTKPFPCLGRCVFCPNDVRMPKSYLADEPGCQRAESLRFDPYLQTWTRLAAYRRMGHPTDKVELLVLGGTWSHYPPDYQRWFVARCLEALVDFGAGRDRRAEVRQRTPDFTTTGVRLDGRRLGAGYAPVVLGHLRAHQQGRAVPAWERAGWERVEAAQRAAEGAGSRCVGLVVETRPDCIDPAELARLRRLGVTKLQLGLQSLSDAVLAANRRGHDLAASRRAMQLARSAGLKLHVHWMPNLLGATPESDLEDFARLFDDPALRPDELKIYPCSLVESAELVRHHASGAWRPYATGTLVELLAECLPRVPRWCRVTRVIRDIPSQEILAGNRTTNLREVVEQRCRERGRELREIRSREVRAERVDPAKLRLEAHRYHGGAGSEVFLEWRTPGDRIAGFLRLALPGGPAPLEELAGAAVIREVHVYGAAAALGARGDGRAQHAGLGTRLVEEARRRAAAAGHARLAVVSAVGTREWYRRLGFRDGPLYQHLPLDRDRHLYPHLPLDRDRHLYPHLPLDRDRRLHPQLPLDRDGLVDEHLPPDA